MALTIAIEGKGIIANSDSTTTDTAGGSWGKVGNGSLSLSTETYLYGSSCVTLAVSNEHSALYYDIGSGNELDFDTAGTEEDQFIYMWIQLVNPGLGETLANDGAKIRLYTDLSNYRDYIISASDDLNSWYGNWKCFIIDPTKAGSVTDTGTYDAGSIRYMGVDFDATTTAKGDNVFISQIAVGSGLRITGTSTTPWQDVVDYCTDYPNRAWGMAQEREGLIYIYGMLYWGNSTQPAVSTFTETSAPIIQFGITEYYYSAAWTLTTSTSYCGIVVEDSASYATTFDDGVVVGSDNGRSGATFIGHDDLLVSADLYGGNNASSITRLYSTQFRNMKGALVMGNDAQHLFYGGAVIGSHQFDPVGAPVIRNCVFAETSDADAALLWNSSIDIQDCNFIANTLGAGIEHESGATATYTKLYFNGNTYDVLNSTGSAMTITKSGTPQSDPSSSEGSSVTFQGSVDIVLTVKDEDGNLLSGITSGVYKTSDRTELLQEDTNISGIADDAYTGSTPVEVEVRCRQASSGSTKYKNYSSIQNITSSGLAMTITLVEDPNNNATS